MCLYKGHRLLAFAFTFHFTLQEKWLLQQHPKQQAKVQKRSSANNRKVVELLLNQVLVLRKKLPNVNVSYNILCSKDDRKRLYLGKETYSIYIYKVLKQVNILLNERRSQ